MSSLIIDRFVFIKRIENKHLSLAGIVLFLAGYLYLFLSPIPADSSSTLCLFHQLTGYACPSCGTGRGIRSILHGHFENAFFFNPLSYVAVILSILCVGWLMKDYQRNEFTLLPAMKKPVPAGKLIIPAILLLINWYWNIQKGM